MTISNTLRDFSRTGSPNGSFGVLKIFESMEAGLPVLLSDVKCYREIVENIIVEFVLIHIIRSK